MNEIETLTCEAGHTWTRENKRGRKPTRCPKHPAPAPTSIPVTETLQCAAGHSWTRERTRGRKPPLCPEHAHVAPPVAAPVPVPVAAPVKAPEPVPAPAPPESRPVSVPMVRTRIDSFTDQVAAILANERTNEELKRKLSYCQDQISLGRDEGLISRRRELLREAARTVTA